MKTTNQTALTQHAGHISGCLEKDSRLLQIPSEKPCGYESGRFDFGITHCALRIFLMMQRLQQVVTEAINGYNLLVHGFLQQFGFGHH